MNGNAALAYKAQQVNSANPAQIVFMLYEKAIIHLRDVIAKGESKDVMGRCESNCLAQEIIFQLMDALDHEAAPDFAGRMDKLYRFCINHLVSIDIVGKTQPAQDVIDLLIPLRESWKQLAEKSSEELRIEMRKAHTSQLNQALGNAGFSGNGYQPAPQQNTSYSQEQESVPPRTGISVSI